MKPLVQDALKAQHEALKQRQANTSLIWEPTVTAKRAAPGVTIEIESELIALIERPLDPCETHRAGHDRKERELYALLERLTDLEAHALSRRLASARTSDPIVTAFTRILADRRGRIIAFIGDTRRRNALRR